MAGSSLNFKNYVFDLVIRSEQNSEEVIKPLVYICEVYPPYDGVREITEVVIRDDQQQIVFKGDVFMLGDLIEQLGNLFDLWNNGLLKDVIERAAKKRS